MLRPTLCVEIGTKMIKDLCRSPCYHFGATGARGSVSMKVRVRWTVDGVYLWQISGAIENASPNTVLRPALQPSTKET